MKLPSSRIIVTIIFLLKGFDVRTDRRINSSQWYTIHRLFIRRKTYEKLHAYKQQTEKIIRTLRYLTTKQSIREIVQIYSHEGRYYCRKNAKR